MANLTPEDLYVLLGKLRHVFAAGDRSRYLVPDEALSEFMRHCETRIGEAYFRTPRTTIKSFVDLLAVLDQNPGSDWHALLGTVEVEPDHEPEILSAVDGDDGGTDDELSSFRL